MNKTFSRNILLVLVITGLQLTSCAVEEPVVDRNLPPEQYPVEFSLRQRIISSATRVAGSTGGKTVWIDGDQVGVYAGAQDNASVLTLDAAGKVTASEPKLYWKTKEEAEVVGWYPLQKEISFIDQSQPLYVMKAVASSRYDMGPVTLEFRHQLARVRVKVNCAEPGTVFNKVYVLAPETCTNTYGTLNPGVEGYIEMRRVEDGPDVYYEADILPFDHPANSVVFRLDHVDCSLGKDFTATAGQLVSATLAYNSPYCHIPDKAFSDALLSAGDTDMDGHLSLEEAALVKSVNLSGKHAATLQGIEYLTGLESLDCSNNEIQKINLQNCPNLKKLDCSGNLLTSLDISKNKLLTDLNAMDNPLSVVYIWSYGAEFANYLIPLDTVTKVKE